jgi:hypothetical protein
VYLCCCVSCEEEWKELLQRKVEVNCIVSDGKTDSGSIALLVPEKVN